MKARGFGRGLSSFQEHDKVMHQGTPQLHEANFMKAIWGNKLNEIEIITPHGAIVQKPTDEMITNYNTTSGFALPNSYCDFIKRFGPGEIAERYTIRGPGYALEGNKQDLKISNIITDLLYYNSHLRKEGGPLDFNFLVDYYQNAEKIYNMVFFADSLYSEPIGWDPTTAGDTGECQVFILIREDDQARLLSDDFASFITDVCLGMHYYKLLDDLSHTSADEPPKVFKPASFISRQKQ